MRTGTRSAVVSEFDSKDFRNALGSFATGVTVVTTQDASGKYAGVTANSFNSVSLDPPLVLWSIDKTSTSYETFSVAKYWNVHILAADQENLSNTFAQRGGDKFEGVASTLSDNAAPVLEGCVAVFECEIEHQYPGGDHIILVGRVLNYRNEKKAPLVYCQGAYARLAQ